MARYFLDSSALAKRYHEEDGSAAVAELLGRSGDHFFVSRLAIVEIHSALARLAREGVLDESDLGKLLARVREDVAANAFSVAAVSGPRLDEASLLLTTHGVKHNLRSLDAIHLATAQSLHARSRLTAVVAADQKLLTAATACGLNVLDVG